MTYIALFSANLSEMHESRRVATAAAAGIVPLRQAPRFHSQKKPRAGALGGRIVPTQAAAGLFGAFFLATCVPLDLWLATLAWLVLCELCLVVLAFGAAGAWAKEEPAARAKAAATSARRVRFMRDRKDVEENRPGIRTRPSPTTHRLASG
jgi:hypothetical protein